MKNWSWQWTGSLALLLATGCLTARAAVTAQGPIQGEPIEGILTVLNGDPEPSSGLGPIRIHILEADDGRRFELDFSKSSSAGSIGLDGMRVRVTTATPWTSVHGVTTRVNVQDVEPLETHSPLTLAKISGSQAYVSILCRYAGDSNEPRPPSFFVTQLGASYPGFNHYFREISYNQINLDGSTVSAAWVSLPQPRSFYIDGVKPSSTYLNELAKDCTDAAASTVDFSKYYGFNLMFNDKIDNAAWGGTSVLTLSGIRKAWPTTWMPYYGEDNTFGWRRHAILAHEMAHAFGAPHSESPDGDEYGNGWDVVSAPGAGCVTVIDPTYACVGQSMNAIAKVVMDVIPASRTATAGSGTNTYTIERLEQPAGNGPVMVKVDIAGTNARFYTVESRFRVGYDMSLPGDGVIIHEIDTNRSRPARLVVPGGGTGTDLGGDKAIWPVGSTFTSAADNVSIKVNSFSSTGQANVTVSAAAGAPVGLASTDNVTGLWWNANESGWGVNLNHQGTNIFVSLFTYAAGAGTSNPPLWVVSTLAQQPDGSFKGQLFQTTGPAFNANPFTPIGGSNVTNVGPMTITFASKSQATMQYSIAEIDAAIITKQITPQPVGTATTCRNVATGAGARASRTNYTDLWWVAAESGWGVNVTHQGDTIFAALFTYEAGSGTNNRGTWFVSTGTKQSDGSFSGDLLQTTGPAFGSNPFTPIGGSNVTKVGTMTFAFTDGERGTLTYSVNGQTVQKAIVPQTFGTQLPSCS